MKKAKKKKRAYGGRPNGQGGKIRDKKIIEAQLRGEQIRVVE